MTEKWAWIAEHWEFSVGTALAVIGIVIAVVTAFYQRQPKQLDYQVMSDIRILSHEARDLREQLGVTYGGMTLTDPRIVVVRIWNTGKKSVLATDFAGGVPITISYERNPPKHVKVIGASDGLSADEVGVLEHRPDSGTVQVIPNLINRNEWFDIQLLSDCSHGEIAATTRFADQKGPMRRLDRFNPPMSGRTELLMLFGVLLIAAILVAYILAGLGEYFVALTIVMITLAFVIIVVKAIQLIPPSSARDS